MFSLEPQPHALLQLLTLGLALSISGCGEGEAEDSTTSFGPATTGSGDGDGDGDPNPSETSTSESDSESEGEGECGDGVVDPGEECDIGEQNSDTGQCTTLCEIAECGDGFVYEGTEECDDGNMDDSDACVSGCKLATCGDGFVETGVEECDDGNDDPADMCGSDCTLTNCGDGIVQDGEQCDDGNEDTSDDCPACQFAFCGDGYIQAGIELCDDGNLESNDACISPTCVPAECGDGFVWEGTEECDDGNLDASDACTDICTEAFCGDGFVEAELEECDDANDIDDDACTNLCEYNSAISCKTILDANPNATTGVYLIDPDDVGPNEPGLVVCDMDTDNGGWTLVGSTRTTTFNDQASDYYDDLQTINPEGGHEGIWDGMRPLINGNSDIRFTCLQDPDGDELDVDLSFYNIIWYTEISTGTDAQSCFSESNGANDDQPTPARRNNLTDAELMANDQWGAGYLEGEDSCTDTGDFTVDFDDRGMDSNQSDGTDWGEDDSSKKCGMSGINDGAWHIWVREL